MYKNEKNLYIIAGANGSGKTTFASQFAIQENINFINADEIAKSFMSDKIQNVKIKAGRQFFKELKILLKQEKPFIVETTLSGKYMINVIKEAKIKGFIIKLIYLFLETTDENIFRVKNRALQGGHNVPVEDILRRFHRSRDLFWHLYKNIVNEWVLIYNGDNSFEIVADNKDIYDDELLKKFIGTING